MKAEQPKTHMAAKRKKVRAKKSRSIRHMPPQQAGTLDEIHIDPPYYLDDLGRTGFDKQTREQLSASLLRQRLTKERVLYYPASGFDWSPISRFADQCSVFIYCDWKTKLTDFEHAMLQVPQNNPALNCLKCNHDNSSPVNPYDLFAGRAVDPLGYATHEDYEQLKLRYENERQTACQPWGRMVSAMSVIDGVERPIEIVFLCVEGVSAYAGLFKAQKRAPHVLCIKECGDGFGGNWTAFYHWDEPLGRAVESGSRENGVAPAFVVTEREDFDWPWKRIADELYFKPS